MNVGAAHSELLHLFKTPNLLVVLFHILKCHDDFLALQKLGHDMAYHLPLSLTLLMMFQSFLRFNKKNVHTFLTVLKDFFLNVINC
jgi:hypothetical protein